MRTPAISSSEADCLKRKPASGRDRHYTWVDQHNTLGLGPDVPISTGNENDALLALVDGKWVVLRVPTR
jgi:hypothetical protein